MVTVNPTREKKSSRTPDVRSTNSKREFSMSVFPIEMELIQTHTLNVRDACLQKKNAKHVRVRQIVHLWQIHHDKLFHKRDPLHVKILELRIKIQHTFVRR